MKEISQFEIKKSIDFSKLLVGRIVSVDADKLIAKVDLLDAPGRIETVSIPFGYVSSVDTSYMVFVPKEGDRVIVGMKQGGDWEILGYRPGVEVNDSEWTGMKQTEKPVRAMNLNKGDFAIGVHNDTKSVDFLMSTDGKMVLSAGLVYMVLDQAWSALYEIMGYKRWDTDGMTMEWGEARVFDTGLWSIIPNEKLWRIQAGEEEIGLGYINKLGVPEVVEEDDVTGSVRFKVKVGTTVITVTDDGSVLIKADDVIVSKIATGEKIKIGEGSIEVTAPITQVHGELEVDDSTVLHNTLEVDNSTVLHDTLVVDDDTNLKENLTVDRNGSISGELDVKQDSRFDRNVEIARDLIVGNKLSSRYGVIGESVRALVLETVLPILAAHTHPYSDGVTGASAELGGIPAFKTVKFAAE